MPSLAELRNKVRSITSTRKITKAMKMVAGARFVKTQKQALDSIPFAREMERMLFGVAANTVPSGKIKPFFSPEKTPGEPYGMIIITGDKGLCGDFNNTVVRAAQKLLIQRAAEGRQAWLFCVGRKGTDAFAKTPYKIVKTYINVFADINAASGKAEQTAADVIACYLGEKLSDLTVVCNQFKSVMRPELTIMKLLPIERKTGAAAGPKYDYFYEPEENELLAALVPAYIQSQIYKLFINSSAAELAARMTAMDNATRNAGDIIEHFTLEMNKVRQAGITRELTEIVGTSEVLK